MKLEEQSIESSSGEYARNVWLLHNAANASQRLCVFLDGELYLNQMNAPAILIGLQQQSLIPPMTALFVSHLTGEARHYDYTCNERYFQFIANDIVHWVRARYENISEGNHLICGLSLSGLASAYLGLTRPDVFSRALCQSGSFWWNEEWLTKHAASFSSHPGKFWLSVGDQEVTSGIAHPPTDMRQDVSQIVGVENASQELKRLGHSVHTHIYSGGHDIVPWQQELPLALNWLFAQTIKQQTR